MISRHQEYRRQAARVELRKGLYESSRAVDTVGGLPRASSRASIGLSKNGKIWRQKLRFLRLGEFVLDGIIFFRIA